MSWTFVVRQTEMDDFGRCRRAWDFSARIRQNYVPVVPPRVADFDKAIHDALAVYYYPAMDDWDRAIVRPLAVAGFRRAMQQDRDAYERITALTPDQDQEWQEEVAWGEAFLGRYLTWALTVDEFDSIFVDEELWSPIPDPANPAEGMVMPSGQTIRYLGRMDLLMSDTDDEYWVVDHRVVRGDWMPNELLRVDTTVPALTWAVENCYLHLTVAGTVYNELRVAGIGAGEVLPPSPEEIAERDPRDMTRVRRVARRRGFESVGDPATDETRIERQETSDEFRRTWVRRSRADIANASRRLSEQTLDIRNPAVAVYPNPSPVNCTPCRFRSPCLAETRAPGGAAAILASEYRVRTEAELEEERLRWSATRRGTRAAYGGTAYRPQRRPDD